MLALLAACAIGVAAPHEVPPPDDPAPALTALGPQPRGATALTLLAGRPMNSVRVDHGFGEAADAGLGLDISRRGNVRPVLRGRVRAFRFSGLQLGLRGALGTLIVRTAGVLRTVDAELGLQLAYAPLARLAAFADVALLAATDFTREHSAGFAQAQAGLAFAPPGPFSLLASAGVLQGSRGRRAIGSGGVAFRF